VDAKANLSRLIDQAVKGETFVITKSGVPVVQVVAIEPPTASQSPRLGFIEGQASVPDDFDRMGQEEIEGLFGIAV